MVVGLLATPDDVFAAFPDKKGKHRGPKENRMPMKYRLATFAQRQQY